MRWWVTAAASLCFTGCCKKPVESTQRADSVSVVKTVRYVERVRDSVIYVSLPAESMEVVRRDSSRLHTSLAESFAAVMADGSLFHTLANKKEPQQVSVQLRDAARTESRDSVRVEYVLKKEVVRERYVPRLYKWSFFVSLVCGAYAVIRLWRRIGLRPGGR